MNLGKDNIVKLLINFSVPAAEFLSLACTGSAVFAAVYGMKKRGLI